MLFVFAGCELLRVLIENVTMYGEDTSRGEWLQHLDFYLARIAF